MFSSGTPFNVSIFVLIRIELFATGMPGRDGGLLAWFCWRFRPELTPLGGALWLKSHQNVPKTPKKIFDNF